MSAPRFKRASNKFGELQRGPLGNSMKTYKHLLQGLVSEDKTQKAFNEAKTEEDYRNVEVLVTEFERIVTDLIYLSEPGRVQEVLRLHQESFALELQNFKDCEEKLSTFDRNCGNILIERISGLLNETKSDEDTLIACNSASKFRHELVGITNFCG